MTLMLGVLAYAVYRKLYSRVSEKGGEKPHLHIKLMPGLMIFGIGLMLKQRQVKKMISSYVGERC